MIAKSYSEAKKLGLTRYFTGRPCRKAGHISERSANNGECCECKNARSRLAYEKNIDKERERNKLKRKLAYAKNPQKYRDVQKSYYQKNIDKAREIARVRSAQWRLVNPNHKGVREAKQLWKASNRGYAKISKMKRTEATKLRIPNWLTKNDFWMMEEAYQLAKVRTELFGFKWDIDHILPLQGKHVSGLHVPANLQVIPQIENLRKNNKYTPA